VRTAEARVADRLERMLANLPSPDNPRTRLFSSDSTYTNLRTVKLPVVRYYGHQVLVRPADQGAQIRQFGSASLLKPTCRRWTLATLRRGPGSQLAMLAQVE
jgi:hypothetical protein